MASKFFELSLVKLELYESNELTNLVQLWPGRQVALPGMTVGDPLRAKGCESVIRRQSQSENQHLRRASSGLDSYSTEHVGEIVVTCGLVVEQRTRHQITGEPMKFLTLADWTGMVETELFATTYRNYGLATIRYPVLEVEATVEPFENGRGFSLRVRRAGKPRHSQNKN